MISGIEAIDHQNNPGTILWKSNSLSGDFPHNLTISNASDVPAWFFALQAIVIANGTVPASLTAFVNATDTPSSTSKYQSTQIIEGTLITGFIVILYIAVALALRYRRTRLRRARELHPFIQPFNLHPFTLIRRGLLHASDRVVKGRILPESPIIPSKFRNTENATANLANAQAIIPQPSSSSPVPEPLLEPSPPLLNISHLREQDSGLRNVEEDAEEENMVILLPPEYTAT